MDIQVNFDVREGKIKNLNGVNDGPKCLKEIGDCNLCERYKEMGINVVRTHDFYGPTDWNYIFPDFSKDPEDPTAYNFFESDQYIKSIFECGQEIYFRMGISWDGDPTPPPAPEKWAKIVVQILKHYNDGWNNGYNFAIKWVEIWNEPDLDIFWSGSPSEYFVLYAYAANEIKNYNPNIKVGGPGLCCRINFLEGFLDYCQKNSIPLDFVSWHHYSSKEEQYNPASFKNWASFIRNLMNKYGFFNAQSHLTEFSRSLEEDQLYNNLNLTGAAWNASALIKLQDSNVDYAFRYRGDVHPLGLWWPQEVQWVVQESFVSLAQFNKYPNRCQIIGLLDISEESALAGCSDDEKNCIVLLADPSPKNNEISIILKGFKDNDWKLLFKVLKDEGWSLLFEENFSGTEFSKSFSQQGPLLAIVKISIRSKHKRPMDRP